MTKSNTKPVNRVAAGVPDQSLEGLLGYHIRRAWGVIQADLAAALAPMKLRMITFSTLVLVVDNPGLSQSRAARAIAVERSNFVGLVDELEQRGLINRDRMPSDRRSYGLWPTDKGRRLCTRALSAVRAHEERLFAGLDDDEKRLIAKLMDRIRSGRRAP